MMELNLNQYSIKRPDLLNKVDIMSCTILELCATTWEDEHIFICRHLHPVLICFIRHELSMRDIAQPDLQFPTNKEERKLAPYSLKTVF